MSDVPQVLLGHHLKALKLPTFLREYDKLADALEEVERIYDAMYRPAVYAMLLFSADTSKPIHRDLQQRAQTDARTGLATRSVFSARSYTRTAVRTCATSWP